MRTATPTSSLVRPETRRLAYLTRWALRAMFLLGVIAALASQAKAAPVVFEVSGGNPDDYGVVLSGTVTIDTATGKVLSANVTAAHVLYDGSFTEFVFDIDGSVHQFVVGSGSRSEIFTKISILSEYGGGTGLYLTVRESTLVGYKGSSLSAAGPEGSCIVLPYSGNRYSVDEIPLYGSLEPNE